MHVQKGRIPCPRLHFTCSGQLKTLEIDEAMYLGTGAIPSSWLSQHHQPGLRNSVENSVIFWLA